MNDTPALTRDSHVTAADIARLAGVTRAAVSNWRRRHGDFPEPVAGTAASPLFSQADVRAWLDSQHKGPGVSEEVQLWNTLRGGYPEAILGGLADVAELLAGGAPDRLPPEAADTARLLAAQTSPAQVVTDLIARLAAAAQRAGSDATTPPRLVRAITRHSDTAAATVFDPACGTGSLLLAAGAPGARRTGQDIDPDAERLTRLRVRLEHSADADLRIGDSLRADEWPDHRAELVVCDPPNATPDWGREELLLDPRWELAVPPRAESELAWLQHAYAHTAPGGQAAVVMSASAAYRRTGRRIRADLVRRGLLTGVVALPAGLAPGHTQPVHLWLLRRPVATADPVSHVRMVDLTAADPDGPMAAEPGQQADVPLVELLDDQVDLTPAHRIAPAAADYPADYAAVRARLDEAVSQLADALPRLAAGPGDLGGAQVRLADLADAGLIALEEGEAHSVSDRLDTDFLNGFVRSAANTRRSTSASGTFRADSRSARIPQMAVEEQRRYGAAFRALTEVEKQASEFAELAAQAVRLAREGLTTGGLAPEQQPPA